MSLPSLRAWARRASSLLAPAVALVLVLGHASARADLWSYVDEQGVTHFAAEKIDERYQLYFKGSDVSRLSLTAETRLANPGAVARAGVMGLRTPGVAGQGAPAFKVPQRFAAIDDSRSYKAVQKHLRAAAKQHAVDYELLKAVVAAESGFDPAAVSPKGAVGLMQLLPTTAVMYGVSADREGRKDRKGQPIAAQSVEQKLTDPRTNVFAGARYLAYLLKLFKGETALAVAAYNAGEGAVQRAGNRIPNYKETQGYVRTVMGLYGAFKPDATVAVASSGVGSNSAPVARAAGKVGGRVRVELGGSPAKGRAAPAETPAPSAATPVDTGWVPVVYRTTPSSPAGGE
ncbi:lytic transglycosylase domain-containing protein [Ottowia sp. GY511]|uniref:Lytic transglycosylase domain-containing protein n=1 Tax=Ottowia flava TaxID=2675430 RepID=A0ABW4KU06_9BURK|nr:lytic transglycosylase domain-containing protein [Ottowia sp. GY511]TXK33480.1 lytic transglycosylase domain-containing protein [Ottowia sp. GY511]